MIRTKALPKHAFWRTPSPRRLLGQIEEPPLLLWIDRDISCADSMDFDGSLKITSILLRVGGMLLHVVQSFLTCRCREQLLQRRTVRCSGGLSRKRGGVTGAHFHQQNTVNVASEPPVFSNASLCRVACRSGRRCNVKDQRDSAFVEKKISGAAATLCCEGGPMEHTISLQINGKQTAFAAPQPCYLAEVVRQLDLRPDRVALELNGTIVPRAQWPEYWSSVRRSPTR